MTIRANSDSRFNARFLIIGLILAGFGLYSLYDGFIAYPKSLEKAKAFYTYGVLEDGAGEMGWKPIPADLWEERAKANNWSLEKPKTPDVIQSNIYVQYAMAVVSFLLCVPVFVHYVRFRSAWIEGDEQGLRNHRGQSLAFEQITSVDKTRWTKKGIAKVHFAGAQGTGVFVIDDLKFVREPTDQIVELMESKIDEKLVHGAPLESQLPKNSAADSDENAAESGKLEKPADS